jgi:hypothetical protein
MLREGNMGWALMLLVLFGAVAGPSAAGWAQSSAPAAAPTPAPSAASPGAPSSAAGTREAEVIALLREATRLPEATTLKELGASSVGQRRIATLVVSVPDPRQSLVSFYFDQAIETLVSAAEAVGLAKDRYLFPWRPANGAAAANWTPELQSGPGVMLFRSASLEQASGAEVEWLVVFLVGESPVLGARDADLEQALGWAAALSSDRRAPVRVLGPFFSGAARSLRGALDRASAAGELGSARIITGTATAGSIAALLSTPQLSFSRTVPVDDELLEFLVCEIEKRHAPERPRIAMLAEIGTVFGSGLSPRDGRSSASGPEPVQPGAPSSGSTLPRPECRKPSLPTFRFPLHIAQLQAIRQRGPKPADEAVASLRRTLELRLDRDEGATADTPPVFSALTAHESELELRQLLQRICADRTQYLVLAATDPVDVVFLGQEARKYCPGMALATLGADVLFTHPDLRATFSGALVASPYPLLFETAALTSWRQSTPFASDIAQGFYNAALALLTEARPATPPSLRPPPLLRYRIPGDECPPDRLCPDHGPQLWLTMIANNAYWPLAKSVAWRSLEQSYQPPDARRELGVRPPRAHQLRPPGLAAALAGLVLLFATLHLVYALRDAVRPWREAWRGPTVAGETRSPRRVSTDVEEGTSAESPIVPGSTCPSPAQRGRGEPDTNLGHEVLAPTPDPLVPNDLAQLRYTLTVHLSLAGLISLTLPTVTVITAPDRVLANAAIGYARALAVALAAAAVGALAGTAYKAFLAAGAARASRRPQPRVPTPSDDTLALTVQAAATLLTLSLLFWLGAAGMGWLDSWRALGDGEKLLVLTRSIDPLGMSPLLPLVYLAAALYLWGAAGLRRVAAEQRFTRRSPFPLDIDGETLQGLTRKLQRIWHGAQLTAEVWTLGALALPAVYFWRRLLPTFEGDAYDALLRAGFVVVYGTVVFACVKLTLSWQLLSRFLRQLAAQPMIDAYDRVALKVAGSFGLQFSARVPDPREFETSAYNCQLLAALAAQIGSSGSPQGPLLSAAAADLAVASERLQANVALDSSRSQEASAAGTATASGQGSAPLEHPHSVLVESAPSLGNMSSDLRSLVARATDPPDGARQARPTARRSSDQLQAETHTSFFEASATMFSALRKLWQARVRQPVAGAVSSRNDLDDLLPGGRHAKLPTAVWYMRAVSTDVYLWTRMAEDFVALRVVTFIHHILFQLRNLLVFALSGALALVLIVASYPLQPSRFVTVFAWLCMLLVILVGLSSILFMERNELLSRLGSSGPGRLNLSVPFVGQLLMYVALPAAVVIASVFPEVSELLFSWLEPLARLLP